MDDSYFKVAKEWKKAAVLTNSANAPKSLGSYNLVIIGANINGKIWDIKFPEATVDIFLKNSISEKDKFLNLKRFNLIRWFFYDFFD